MKTIPQLTKKINEITDSLSDKKRDKKKDKRLKAKLTLLRQYVRYLETNPTKELMNSEIEKLNNKLNIIKERFPKWCNDDEAKITSKLMLKEYNKLNRVSYFKKQLATLNFLNS